MAQVNISAATTDELHRVLGALATKSGVLSGIPTLDLIEELRERMGKRGHVVNIEPVEPFADQPSEENTVQPMRKKPRPV
jgi:hypothetical protein